nr:EOG090X06GX [Triops cancriformis]
MDKGVVIQFRNCCILRNHQIIREDLWTRNGKIINPEPLFFDEKISADVQIDCHNALIAPGFIDLQINGGFGIDFSNGGEDIVAGIRKVAKGILAHGVTSFCPTIVTSPPSVYHEMLPKVHKTPGSIEGAEVLGVHLEGPFISPSRKGAHDTRYMQDFSQGFEILTKVYKTLENLCIITLAPELPGAVEVIPKLIQSGVTVSLGHSIGSLSDGEKAALHGASFITHLFNAMLPFHHRDPGLVGLLASDAIPKGKTIYYGIIADGIHTHLAALRIAHRTHPEGLVLVTDAMSALGLKAGRYNLASQQVDVTEDSAYVAGTTTLCGSIAQMDKCVRIFKKATGCSLVAALEAATLHPALAVGLQKKKGTLNFGADADFVFLGPDLEVWSTWIASEKVYQNPNGLTPVMVNVKEL